MTFEERPSLRESMASLDHFLHDQETGLHCLLSTPPFDDRGQKLYITRASSHDQETGFTPSVGSSGLVPQDHEDRSSRLVVQSCSSSFPFNFEFFPFRRFRGH